MALSSELLIVLVVVSATSAHVSSIGGSAANVGYYGNQQSGYKRNNVYAHDKTSGSSYLDASGHKTSYNQGSINSGGLLGLGGGIGGVFYQNQAGSLKAGNQHSSNKVYKSSSSSGYNNQDINLGANINNAGLWGGNSAGLGYSNKNNGAYKRNNVYAHDKSSSSNYVDAQGHKTSYKQANVQPGLLGLGGSIDGVSYSSQGGSIKAGSRHSSNKVYKSSSGEGYNNKNTNLNVNANNGLW
jgi:hypothetical protein